MDTVKVTVLKAFFLGGKNIKPGLREVPADKVERLVRLKKIAAPDGSAGAADSSDGARVESAAVRLGALAGIEREEGEGVADYLERLAGAGGESEESGVDDSWEGLGVPELRRRAKAVGVKGFSSMARRDLVEALKV